MTETKCFIFYLHNYFQILQRKLKTQHAVNHSTMANATYKNNKYDKSIVYRLHSQYHVHSAHLR